MVNMGIFVVSPTVSYCSLKGASSVSLSRQNACYASYKSFLLQSAKNSAVQSKQQSLMHGSDIEVIRQCNICSSQKSTSTLKRR